VGIYTPYVAIANADTYRIVARKRYIWGDNPCRRGTLANTLVILCIIATQTIKSNLNVIVDMELDEQQFQIGEGDLKNRRRKVKDILTEGVEYRADESDTWMFGPLEVRHHPQEGFLAIHSPDGDLYEVSIPSTAPIEEQIEAVECELRGCWNHWKQSL